MSEFVPNAGRVEDGISMSREYSERVPGASVVLKKDRNGEILYLNRTALNLFECKSRKEFDELTGGDFVGMLCREDRRSVRFSIEERRNRSDAAQTGQEDSPCDLHIQFRIKTRSGRRVPVHCYVNFVEDPENGSLCYLLLLPLSKEEMSDTDSLTGLANMQSALRCAERLSSGELSDDYYCVYINLSDFKRFNLRYGFEEGDKLLCRTAEILKECFPDEMISRFFADNFGFFTTKDDVEERLTEAHARIRAIERPAGIEMKAGLFLVDGERPVDPSVAVQYSKIACDMIHSDPDRFLQNYNEEASQKIKLRHYVEENIDRALRKKQIKVYYQPQIRSVSGNICGFEALSRWDSMWYGMLQPADFIKTLEECHKIHKLDIYVVNEICRQIREELDAGNPVVPISFNLSSLDFVLCDMFEEIEKSVLKYDVPRSYLRIEITESVLAEDRATMKKKIDQFRDVGYNIWMDDFGSEFSSLNVLKDYHFDSLKIDMEFLRTFTEESRKIISSAAKMAKEIGTNAIGEGVETREQAEFLRTIGCGMQQGFYYGRPMPYQESVRKCKEKGFLTETSDWRRYYDAISMVDVQTDSPMYISEYNGSTIKILFENEACKRLQSERSRENRVGTDTLLLDLYDDDNMAFMKDFLDSNDWIVGEEPKQLAWREGDHVIFDRIRLIGENEGRRAFCVYINDIAHYPIAQRDDARKEAASRALRDQASHYDNVYRVYLEKDYLVTKYRDLFYDRVPGTQYQGVQGYVDEFGKKLIHPDDWKRYSQEMNAAKIAETLRKYGSRAIYEEFRVLCRDGDYKWKLFMFTLDQDGEETILLVTMRDSEIQMDDVRDAILGEPEGAARGMQAAAETSEAGLNEAANE